MNHGLIPYIGGKHRLARRLVEYCRATGADTFVDVFGGSAAVMLAAPGKFSKLVYNDIDGDLVNLFRVLADDQKRLSLFRCLKNLPPSRRIYNEDHEKYVAGGFSFSACQDSVERARRTFYRHCFAFGGKTRSGGFSVSTGDPTRIKEVQRYRNTLRKLAMVGAIFKKSLIENLHYSDIISFYGRRQESVLFIDPPYHGSEEYYSRTFNSAEHVFLANQLAYCNAKVVCTYYDTPLIRSLYPKDQWAWISIQATKNCCLTRGNKAVSNEMVIIKI